MPIKVDWHFRGIGRRTVWVIAMVISLTSIKSAYSGETYNPMHYSIQIIDEARSLQPQDASSSLDSISDPIFKNFVSTVSADLLARVNELTFAKREARDEIAIELLFVRRPLLRADGAPILPTSILDLPYTARVRRLDGPWVKMSIPKAGDGKIRAIFVWSERQFLVDQAIMAGETIDPNDSTLPIEGKLYGTSATDYARSIISVPSLKALPDIKKRILPELVWLFRHAPQSTRGPFSVISLAALQEVIKRASPGFTELTMWLSDNRLTSQQTEQRYDTILDVKVNTAHYKLP